MDTMSLLLAIKAIYITLISFWDYMLYKMFRPGDFLEDSASRKIAIVTGSNTGIGKQVAMDLAKRGATVILACRNLQLGKQAVNEIKTSIQFASVELMHLDVTDFASVHKFATDFSLRYHELHLLINNAGICSYKSKIQKTKRGIEIHMATNHLGHFLLTKLLLEKLKAGAPSRIVNIVSTSLLTSDLRLDDLNMKHFKNPMVFTGFTYLPYDNSKMAKLLFTSELGRRLEGTGVTAYAVCPGIVRTDVFRDLTDTFIKMWLNFLIALVGISPDKASIGILYCALSKECKSESGKCYRFGKIFHLASAMVNPKDARKLWAVSESLVS